MLNKFIGFFMVAVFVFFTVSCGDDGNDDKKEKENPDSEQEIIVDEDEEHDEAEEIDEDEVEILPEYPVVTSSSKKKGEIAQNLSFFNHEDKELTLGHFYKKKKLVWLIFSTYDCPACNVEKQDIPKLNKADYKERGFETILIMNGLLRGPQPDLEPGKISNLRDAMMTSYGEGGDHVYGYLAHGQQMTFQKFINQGYPVNIMIDANTMEILDHWEGWDPNGVNRLDKFINFMLDEL